MDVSVVVVAYRNDSSDLAALSRCVHSSAAESGLDAEVIVVQNDSGPRYAGSDVTTLFGQGNIGFGAAVNQGVRAARGRGVLALNPDCMPDGDVVRDLLRRCTSVEEDEVAAPLVTDANGRPSYAAYADWVFTPGRMLARLHAWWFLSRSTAETLPLGLKLPGTALIFRCDTALRLGPFDDRYFLYGEDRDLCRRARQSGVRLRLMRKTRIKHHGGVSGVGVRQLVARAQADSALRVAFGRYGSIGLVCAAVDLWLTAALRPLGTRRTLLPARCRATSHWFGSLLSSRRAPDASCVLGVVGPDISAEA